MVVNMACLLCWPYECPQVSLSLGAAHRCFGAALSSKNEEKKKRFYGFTDLRGKPAGRGRDGRGSRNQNIAGRRNYKFRKEVVDEDRSGWRMVGRRFYRDAG